MFRADLPEILKKAKVLKKEITYADFSDFVSVWLRENA